MLYPVSIRLLKLCRLFTETMLGPYYGKPVTQIDNELHNEWLWEVSASIIARLIACVIDCMSDVRHGME